MTERTSFQLGLRIASASFLSFGLFFPYFLEQIGGLRLWIAAIGFFAMAVEVALSPQSVLRRVLIVAASGLYIVVVGSSVELGARALGDRFFAVNAEHLFVLLPLFATLGWLIYRSDGSRVYLLTFLGFASLVAAMALAESALDHSLLGRDLEFASSQREGPTRAIVGSEHVLVLGATLAAAVPLTLKLKLARSRIIISFLLTAGSWATGSRAPALICTAIAIFQLFPILRRALQRQVWILHSLAVALLAALTYLALAVWKPSIPGATGLEYSSNYRSAIYSLLPRILSEHPLGYLLQGTPIGVWLVPSELRGVVDIAKSVDSEIIYAAFGLGWIGLFFFTACLFVSIAAIKHDMSIGLSALTLTSIGFILSLHGWDAMSPFWYLLVGISVGLTVSPLAGKFRNRRGAAREPLREIAVD
jgi:hypothetical protein